MTQASVNATSLSWPVIEDRAVAAYLGLAIGDALGATVEFMTPREIASEYGLHDRIRGGGWLKLPKGRVTDDTEMALALGEAILERGAVEAPAVADAFDRWMRRKPVDIGNTVRRGLIEYRRSGQSAVPLNEFDAGNGACMRVLPVALATLGAGSDTVRLATETQSHVTHNNPLSDAGTLCVVQMIQAALLGADRLELLHGPVKGLVTAQGKFNFRRRRAENPSGYIVDTLKAVFQGLFDTDNFEEALVETVNRGGDADTTGAIVGMIAGACFGTDAIPLRWLEAVDPETMRQCKEQALALVSMSPARRVASEPSG